MLANTDPSSTLLFAAALAADHALTISFNLWFGTALLLAILFLFLLLKLMPSLTYRSMEISEVELGIGQQKITLRPNTVDKQVAYQIWVELSTRKLGIPVDIEKDLIVEVYNSWYKVWGQRVWGQSENSWIEKYLADARDDLAGPLDHGCLFMTDYGEPFNGERLGH